MNILTFPRKPKPHEPLEWKPCKVPLLIRILRPFTDFGQTLRARKNGRWVYMREGDRDYS